MIHDDDQDGEKVKSFSELCADLSTAFRKLFDEVVKAPRPFVNAIIKVAKWLVKELLLLPDKPNNSRMQRGLPPRRRVRRKRQ